MPETAPDPAFDRDYDAEDPAEQLLGLVETYDDAPDEITLVPLGADDEELVTTWISADVDDCVDLEEWR